MENKVHGKVAWSDYIGSMKKAIEVESPTKKKLNVLLYLWQMNWMIMKYAVNKWIMKIHISPEEYKSQHMKIKSHTSIKKSKVE